MPETEEPTPTDEATDEPDVEPAAEPEGSAADEPAEGDLVEPEPWTLSEDVEAPEVDHGDDEADLQPLKVETWKLLVGGAAVVLVVVLAVVIALQVFSSDDEGGGDGGGEEGGSPSIVDSFDRANSPAELGTTESGQPWEAVSGTWGVSEQQAILVEPNPDGVRSIAVVDLGSSDGSVAVTGGTMRQGWGVVFRYQGPFNYWFLTAAPDFATYNLARISNGEFQSLGSVGLAEVADGTEVQIRLSGSTIEIRVAGKLVKAVTDPTLIGATQAGIISTGAEADGATWDDFEATPAAPQATVSSAVTPESVTPVGADGEPVSTTAAGATPPSSAAP